MFVKTNALSDFRPTEIARRHRVLPSRTQRRNPRRVFTTEGTEHHREQSGSLSLCGLRGLHGQAFVRAAALARCARINPGLGVQVGNDAKRRTHSGSTRLTIHLLSRRCASTWLALTACLLGLFAASAAASSVKLPLTDIHEVKLDNGLRALIVENHEAPVIDVQVWYHVGSKNEPPGRTGFAHFSNT